MPGRGHGKPTPTHPTPSYPHMLRPHPLYPNYLLVHLHSVRAASPSPALLVRAQLVVPKPPAARSPGEFHCTLPEPPHPPPPPLPTSGARPPPSVPKTSASASSGESLMSTLQVGEFHHVNTDVGLSLLLVNMCGHGACPPQFFLNDYVHL